ncbi:helix-turn-helix domain-containing protein [Enterococcus gallinarum]|uniref:helix-turn-helix domain-containing protein n=1 Tax=Enterococcus gallinarum TaxID=1353 RepID=UPI003D6C0ABC
MKKKEDILIGQRIKDIRSNLNMDQKTFANKIEATVSALSNWENGRNKPNDIMLRRIAKIGNVSLIYLLDGKKTLDDAISSGMDANSLDEYLTNTRENSYIEAFQKLPELIQSKEGKMLLTEIIHYYELNKDIADNNENMALFLLTFNNLFSKSDYKISDLDDLRLYYRKLLDQLEK